MPGTTMAALFDLSGKTALVTGAGRGLGRAFAEAMAEAGAQVACAGRRLENTAETARLLESMGGNAVGIQADVSQETDVVHMVEKTIEELTE